MTFSSSMPRLQGALVCALFSMLLGCGNEASAPSAAGDTSSQAATVEAADKAASEVVEAAAEGEGDEAVTPASGGSSAEAPDEAIVAIYNRACISCHLSGAAGAPRTHDVAAWEPRMAKGMDALLESIKSGLNSMPPKGMCFDCSDEDYRAVTLFMASEKPAS